MKASLGCLAVAALLVPLAGCGEKYSPACKAAANLTAPWTAFNLPVSDGRVCESDAQRTKIEFVGNDREKWTTAIDQAVLGAGFTKESCPSYCIYTKDTQRLQVIMGEIGHKWVTAAMVMSTSSSRPSAADGSTPNSAVPTDRPASATTPAGVPRDVDSIPECASYFRKLRSCHREKGVISGEEKAKNKRRELQAKLDSGTSGAAEVVRRSCEAFEKLEFCR